MKFDGLRTALQAMQGSNVYRCRAHLRLGGSTTSKNSIDLRTRGSFGLRSRDDSR